MKILLIGDIYGKPGRKVLEAGLPQLVRLHSPDWIIVNGENTSGGNGLSAKHARSIKKLGVDIITSGNHIFARKDWPETLTSESYILRPHNIGGDKFAGTGLKFFEKDNGNKLAVINLAGRVFMERADCPFKTFDRLIKKCDKDIPVIVDFHAEATAEKLALFWHLDGRVIAAVGTHTHVQTSDERILPNGTAIITDLGMTGPRDGIIGVNKKTILDRFQKGYSEKFVSENGIKKIEGLLVEYSQETLKASEVTRIRLIL